MLKIFIIIKNIWGYKIKFIDLDSQFKRIKHNLVNDISLTLDKGDFILGQKVIGLVLFYFGLLSNKFYTLTNNHHLKVL